MGEERKNSYGEGPIKDVNYGLEDSGEEKTPRTLEAGSVTYLQVRCNRRAKIITLILVDFGRESRTPVKCGIAFTISATHHLVYGKIGSVQGQISTSKFALDTVAGFNLILRAALTPDWECIVDKKTDLSNLNDSNGRPLALG